ncbi:MAG TPA: Uma2 family endonuclease [Pyrinomonadaceae bacterium]|nr:Uma2 family endonuclease [Pyrinomonadaceae bacterium]
MAHSLIQADYVIPSELLALRPPVTHEQFEELCGMYDDLRLELTSTGELIVMPPTGSLTGRRNFDLTAQLALWSREHSNGVCFDSSAGFTLPNGAIRSPDVSWIHRERWNSLTKEQKGSFAPICPDFVVEIRSPSDNIKQLFLKMFEYIENGTKLGWLIDPLRRKVYVYIPNKETLVLDNPATVCGDPLLAGFELQLATLWSDE